MVVKLMFAGTCHPAQAQTDNFALEPGAPLAEPCRPPGLKANAIDRWKKPPDHGLRDHGV